jgi:hypothetical protein
MRLLQLDEIPALPAKGLPEEIDTSYWIVVGANQYRLTTDFIPLTKKKTFVEVCKELRSIFLRCSRIRENLGLEPFDLQGGENRWVRNADVGPLLFQSRIRLYGWFLHLFGCSFWRDAGLR